jgi:hypothetical protein
MNREDLERWAINAAQELREIVDDAEEAVAPEERKNVALSTKVLLAEFYDIAAGRAPWTGRLAETGDDFLSAFLDT